METETTLNDQEPPGYPCRVDRLVSPFVPFYDRDGITIYNADCRQVLPFLDRFDLLLTDPPYGIGADKTNAHSSIRDNPDWSHEEWDRIVPQYTIHGLLDAAESQMIWGGNYYQLPPAQCWLIWEKPEAGTGFSMADAELAWTNLKQSVRVKRCNRNDGGRVHPTQKPLSLMKWCCSLLPDANSVLDPFMGSGTTLVAAKLLGLRAVGIEINREYCEAAVERLRQGVFGFGSEG